MIPVRLCLAGFGRWGRNYVRAARESGEAEVSAVVTSHPDELPPGMDHDENLTDEIHRCDAVVYAGHPRGAPLASMIAMHAHKPILVEKPAGLSLSDARHIAASEGGSRAFVLVGHQHLFAAGFEALRSAGAPISSHAQWDGPDGHDFGHLWDYGPHAASVTLALQAQVPTWGIAIRERKAASVRAVFDDATLIYDAYAPAEPALTRQVRAFARAVRAGGTDDWRFGARWAVDVAKVLEAAASTA